MGEKKTHVQRGKRIQEKSGTPVIQHDDFFCAHVYFRRLNNCTETSQRYLLQVYLSASLLLFELSSRKKRDTRGSIIYMSSG